MVLLFTKTKTTFYIYTGTQNGTIKLVGKTFVVCRKSVKTIHVFFHLAFIVYSIN